MTGVSSGPQLSVRPETYTHVPTDHPKLEYVLVNAM